MAEQGRKEGQRSGGTGREGWAQHPAGGIVASHNEPHILHQRNREKQARGMDHQRGIPFLSSPFSFVFIGGKG